jgi:hypothetical protein
MTHQELYRILHEKLLAIAQMHGLTGETVFITSRALSPEEAIGNTCEKIPEL